MVRFPQVVWTSALLVGSFFPLLLPSLCAAATPPSVRGVAVLRSGDTVEVEIQTSQRLSPQVQVLTGPDRIVFDFPGSLPGPALRAVAVPRGEVKGVRVGLFEASPPVTRVVFDLKIPQGYQVFSYGKAVIVKVGGAANAAANPAPTNPPAIVAPPVAPAPPPPPPVTVAFANGLLSVTAERATLAEVLYQIQVHTGADIAVPPGAEQERVVATLGPAPARDVLTQLLDGSSYNFIILGSSQDPNSLEKVILTPRGPALPEVSSAAPPPANPDTDPPQRMVEPPPAVMPGPGPDAAQSSPPPSPPPENPNQPQN